MMISRSCSWCHSTNPASERYCRSCQHEAHVARLDCQCPRCATARRRATGTDTPVPLADFIARALSALRSQSPATDHPADLSPDPERRSDMPARKNHANANAPDPAPVNRDVKRTPVSAELAALIRTLDKALQATFGFDLCYALMARDGIIAASSAVHGYMPPIVAPASPEGVN